MVSCQRDLEISHQRGKRSHAGRKHEKVGHRQVGTHHTIGKGPLYGTWQQKTLPARQAQEKMLINFSNRAYKENQPRLVAAIFHV